MAGESCPMKGKTPDFPMGSVVSRMPARGETRSQTRLSRVKAFQSLMSVAT